MGGACLPVRTTSSQTSDESLVRGILRARLDRSRFFPAHLFAEPAWDMLLALYAAELGRRPMSMTSLCAASNVPTSTAARWIGQLEQDGLIERTADPLDAGLFYLSLSKKAEQSLAQYLSETR